MAADDERQRIHIEGLSPGDVALLRDIAEEASDKSVKKLLTAMGMDTSNPLKSQAVFAFLRKVSHDEEFKADLDWTRRTRKRLDVWGRLIMAAIVAGLISFVQFVVTMAQTFLGRH